MDRFRTFLDRTDATTAVEFAIVGPVFMMFMVGMVYIGLMLFSEGSLIYAVQAGARCAALNTAMCGSSSSTVSFTKNAYFGPTISPTFTSTTATCGQQVTGNASITVDWVVGKATVPLSATSCFP